MFWQVLKKFVCGSTKCFGNGKELAYKEDIPSGGNGIQYFACGNVSVSDKSVILSFAAKAVIIFRNPSKDGLDSIAAAILFPSNTFNGFSLSNNGRALYVPDFGSTNGYNYVAFG